MQKLDLVILAGGKGKRIRKFLKDNPKPLASINDKTFISYLLNHFSKFNFEKIFILAGYRGNKIIKKYHKKFYNLTEIEVIKEKKPLDTGGALSNLKNKKINDFLLINGDSIFMVDNFYNLKKNTIYLTYNSNYRSNSKLNGLNIDSNKNIIFSKRSNYMNAGVYFFKKNFLNLIPSEKISLEDKILPKLIDKKKLKGIISNRFFFDIGTPNNFLKSSKLLKNQFKRPAIFLDRDGVINYDKGYTHMYKNFKFKPNVIKALKFLQSKDYYIFVVTNQAGVAKGIFNLNDFFILHKKINNYLIKKKIFINDIRYCPYHPKAKIKKYKKKTFYRKPGNLMILDILKNWDIDLRKSFMIGDKLSDKLAAKKSNIYFEFDENDLYRQSLKIINKFNK
mgnify:FL=1|tara:strand:- start:3830 stop:5008 length:1179 start_codon:yes stop_codon:yes gene_type:complete